ncbi:RNA-binding protein Nova-1-like isoform X3 [Mya arenaria]|uniref:RNA-binding protein Nova-1-like isoform X3 n=1 Tax=Mya arenaria TaxID=6604 RepID=UPI0022E834FD|nr:RNA-binding protein Nova-1-like isoform X3 [Mya arenaria]XP_052766688.1 RNA-binding protein Nova-1-like isoform X3 [Mya arenaria]
MAMSYDGMNGTDMDTSESRKRPLDTESENGVTKRSNQGAATCHEYPEGEEMSTQQTSTMTELGADNVHLKILVPSIAAGAIIGKGGETIAHVQKEAGARVKMSKANDFYPGTTERVCLIMGAADSVRKVHNFIMEKIREKPDPNPKPEVSKNNFERHRQVTVVNVKILVPNSTAGMIIGKGGNFIKQIKEESGAYVQISQKSKETNLPERCITVAGDMENNKKAVDLILQKIVEDPQSGSCPNISYADYTGPVASANPTGSPFANTNFMQNQQQEMSGVGNNSFAGGATFGFGFNPNALGGANMGGGLANFNIGNLLAGGGMTPGALDSLRMTLRNSGYSDQATEEISSAMSTLANYGILGIMGTQQNVQQAQMSMQGPQPQGMITTAAGTPSQNPQQGYMMSTPTSSGSLFGPVGSGSSGLGSSGSTAANSSLFGSNSPNVQQERYGGSPMLNESYTATPAYPGSQGFTPGGERPPSININQNSFGLGTGMYSPTEDKSATAKQDLEVPESIVGAILGPGGKGIVELQQYTQTNIQISKKGVYMPGTRNRIVTITGTPNNITKAQYLIQQRIQQEEVKRARQAQTSAR